MTAWNKVSKVSKQHSVFFITVLMLDLLNHVSISKASPMNELEFLSGCTCLGYDIAYRCTVCGAGTTTTVWEGTAFQCDATANEIVLRHSQFTNPSSTESGDCSGGSLVAYAIGKEQTCYISQLNATVSADLNGSTIECAFESQGMDEFQAVNTSIINITTEPPPPPTDIKLRNASQDQLVFTWTPGVESCQAVRYIINSTNCGSCPSTTDSTLITCENLNITSIKRVCSLNIRTVVCDDLIDENGRTLQITTKVPSAPTNVKIVPTYHYNREELVRLNISFSGDMDLYNISDGTPGSAVSYNIDIQENSRACNSTHIPSSFCGKGGCNGIIVHTAPCLPSDEVIVSIYATNIFGDGPPSSPIPIDTTQEIIDVQPHSETSTVTKILCKSSLALRNSTCRVMYGPAIRDNCTFNKNASANFEDGAAMIEVSTPQVDVTYCFVVTETSSGSAIAIIEGTFFSKSTPGSSIGVIVASVICIVGAGGLVAVVVTVFVVIFCCCRKKLIKDRPLELEPHSEKPSQTITFSTNSECETIIEVPNSNGPDSLYEELSLTEFDIRGVSHTTRIENFMRLIGYKSTYRPFLGNTYYEFVQGETKDERLDVMLMYTVLTENNTVIGRLFRTKFSSLPLRTYQRGSVTYYKPPKIKEPGWRAFLQSYNGRKFIYENRSHLPDEAKSNLDPGVDINEQLVFIIDKSRMSSKN